MATKPVILFQTPPATGNCTTDSGGLTFSFPQPCGGGGLVSAMVQFWPTGSATTIASANFKINGGAATALTLTPIGGGGGQSATIPLSGFTKDVNTLTVSATDNASTPQTNSADVNFYLRGAFMGAPTSYQQAKKKAPAKKKTGKKK